MQGENLKLMHVVLSTDATSKVPDHSIMSNVKLSSCNVNWQCFRKPVDVAVILVPTSVEISAHN